MNQALLRLSWSRALCASALSLATAVAHAETAGATRTRHDAASKLEKTSDATSEQRRAQAQQLYEQAAQAYASRKNFEAIELFRQSAELEPSPLLSYNMALAYEEAGDVRNALRHFRDYLTHAPDANDAPEVRKRILRLENKLETLGIQQLSVSSNPAGATLWVDGVAVGVTPFTGEFAPGTHSLRLSLNDYETVNVDVELPRRPALTVPFTLNPTRSVQVPPANAGDQAQSPHSDRGAEANGLARIQPLSWGLLGVGVGSLTAGVLFEVSRARSNEQSRDAASPVEAAQAQGAADGKQLASLVLLGAGGAFVVTGSVLALLDLSGGNRASETAKRTPSTPTLASAGCLPGFCSVQLRGSF